MPPCYPWSGWLFFALVLCTQIAPHPGSAKRVKQCESALGPTPQEFITGLPLFTSLHLRGGEHLSWDRSLQPETGGKLPSKTSMSKKNQRTNEGQHERTGVILVFSKLGQRAMSKVAEFPGTEKQSSTSAAVPQDQKLRKKSGRKTGALFRTIGAEEDPDELQIVKSFNDIDYEVRYLCSCTVELHLCTLKQNSDAIQHSQERGHGIDNDREIEARKKEKPKNCKSLSMSSKMERRGPETIRQDARKCKKESAAVVLKRPRVEDTPNTKGTAEASHSRKKAEIVKKAFTALLGSAEPTSSNSEEGSIGSSVMIG